MRARLSRLLLYPIKALPAVPVDRVRVLPSGALEGDRRFALFDEQGLFLNGKREPRVHGLRVDLDLPTWSVVFTRDGVSSSRWSLRQDRAALEAWLTRDFGRPVRLRENADAGFPDDTNAPGPTVISSATLDAVAGWFPGTDVAGMRARFRANLELNDVPPFWEDRLFGGPGQIVRFQVGSVLLEGTNPCQRCVVPSRDALTGQAISGFSKRFSEQRRATLPSWAPAARFDHFYRLAVNTRPPAGFTGGEIAVGDPVTILAV
jgi:uncharacterized protein